eukprot:Lithocolla_globosa_v1_NODE_5187_length_1286_cov_171.666937.p2 type:complete len:166 gc:universal NODE_5187_length_1286_cov_171.666937:25-522(+)
MLRAAARTQKSLTLWNLGQLQRRCETYNPSWDSCLAGGKCKFSLANRFFSIWSRLVVTSEKCRVEFRKLLGSSPRRKSNVKWFSIHDVATDLHENFTEIEKVLRSTAKFGKKSRKKLVAMIDKSRRQLQLEFAACVDVSTSLVTTCYWFEGNGLLGRLTIKYKQC